MVNNPNKYQIFDALQVPLVGSNLVQASAGTGKTYSISVLALRMIIEDKIPVNEILMVTFTNAAVAELEERVRHFILEANRHAQGTSSETKEIRQIIDSAIHKTSENAVQQILTNTLLLLDEIQIYTINSFCQNMLTEYAFETGQLFSSQILADQSQYLIRFANEYWREHISTLSKFLLETIGDSKLDELIIYDNKYGAFSKEVLDRIIVKGSIEINQFVYDKNLNLDKASADLQEAIDVYHNTINKTLVAYEQGEHEILASMGNQSFKRDLESSNLDSKHKVTAIFNKYNFKEEPPKFITKLPDYFIEHLVNIYNAKIVVNDNIREIQKYLIGNGIAYVSKKIKAFKADNNFMSFNDSILLLHEALQKPATLKKIHHPYKALFVDEFQDTDRKQYEIFKSLFQGKSIQFYIGDPKQSIYGFRGADLDSYKLASQEIDHHYNMTTNYRSTDILISAVNELYKNVENPFQDDAIKYEDVKKGKEHGILYQGEQSAEPISVIEYGNKDSLIIDVAKEIESLLTSDYMIHKEGDKPIEVLPKDIVVLTRDKLTGQKIKLQLSKKNIPAVQLADANIFKSDEALWVTHIFKAILRPTASNVNRAIFHPATGITVTNILEVTPEYWIESFNNLRTELIKYGVYPAMMSFLSNFTVQSNIQLRKIEGGDRIIANYSQLVELLHEAEKYKSFQGEELLQWFIQQRSSEDVLEQSDIKTERIESDEDVIQIMTIHKSKGLTYNIVFFVDLDIERNNFDVSKEYNYKDIETDTRRIVKYPDLAEKELHTKQKVQESFRLLYVAITRAVYKINIFTKKGGAFYSYFDVLPEVLKSKWSFTIDEEETSPTYIPSIPKELKNSLKFTNIIDNNWGVMSFSSITTHGGIIEKDEISISNHAFEDFIFHSWGKGAVHGNFIHDTLEDIDFTTTERWSNIIKKQSTLYPTIYNEEHVNYYHEFLAHIVNASLNKEGLKLKDVSFGSRVSEMQFYYDLTDVHLTKIKTLFPDDISLEKGLKTNGIMNGYVDLFFEHNGKYYILDWKSNYLGNHVDAYTPEKLHEAMTINNYHLQYWVYTIAVKRYLEQKITNFDYERDFGGVFYLFVRGIRKDKDTGVFFTKPDINKLNQIDEMGL